MGMPLTFFVSVINRVLFITKSVYYRACKVRLAPYLSEAFYDNFKAYINP